MKHHIFLSYSRKDLDLMRRLRADLQALGFTVWTDEGIEPGTPLWDEAIENALKNAGCMVVMLTPNAIDAKGLRDEIHYANIHEVRIFPVLAAGDAKTSVPYRLSGTQWTDIRTDYAAGLNQLRNATIKHINASTETDANDSPLALFPNLSNILPPPFEWCHIPGGKATLITNKRQPPKFVPGSGPQTFDTFSLTLAEKHSVDFDVPAFGIARYPVTNAQFAKFIESGGYNHRQWWTDRGWKICEEEKWAKPLYWQDPKWNQPDHPVIGVSWYEAYAFCQWLNAALNLPSPSMSQDEDEGFITLPTEQQWQRAAQGDDNREYPWGNNFEKYRCNTDPLNTTPVTFHAGKDRGDSPFGVSDLIENVSQWCLNLWSSDNQIPVETDMHPLRGGYGKINAGYAYFDARCRNNPNKWVDRFGFRIAFSK